VNLQKLRIGYVPYRDDFTAPGDKRRFVYYAKSRNISFEIAKPSKKYDVVILSQRADLSVWSEYDIGGAKIIYDFIDSYLSIPKNNFKARLRGLAKYLSGQSRYLRINHWKALEAMCTRADAVICSTQEQAESILPFCSNVSIILDVHSTVTNMVKTDYHAGKVFNLVWEGLASNVDSFSNLKNVLLKLQSKYKIALHLITDLEFRQYLGLYGNKQTASIVRDLCSNVYLYQWNEHTCANIICSCDLAIIPINLNDMLAKGKPENKLILFWRMGMPTITSATSAYDRAMNAIGFPMTCHTEDDWFYTIEQYIGNEEARRIAGLKGKEFAETEYSETKILQQWDTLFNSLLE